MLMADRIALLRDGRLVQSGPSEELYRRPASLFAAGFFSDINVFSSVVRHGARRHRWAARTSRDLRRARRQGCGAAVRCEGKRRGGQDTRKNFVAPFSGRRGGAAAGRTRR